MAPAERERWEWSDL